MPDNYLPRKLPRNREYPGYQFYCSLRMKNGNSEQCFCRAVLCVVDWLKERLRGTDVIPKQISRLPGREKSVEIHADDLESFTIHSGFSAYVVSLPKHGIWSLRLKESDSDTDQRKAIPGRFFATNVGIHIVNGKEVELGIRIDVTDPVEAPEIAFAFRPKLVRYLHEAEGIIITQIGNLPYQKARAVENDEQMKQLRSILDSSEGTMPIILVTQAIRLPKEDPARDFSKFLAPPPIRYADYDLFSHAKPTASIFDQYYPFNADDIAAHNFGYAITCRVPQAMHDSLARRLKKDYIPGDILLIEPKRFGGRVHSLSKDEKDAVKQVWQYTHSYSKNRKYYFGDVLFEFDARNVENRELIKQIRESGEMAAEEKLARLNKTIDGLQEENEKQARKINDLREQLLNEFKRGEAAEEVRSEQLLEDYDQLEKALHIVQARNLQLEQENREARALRSAVETFRSMAEMPKTNEEVLRYFQKVFGDRVAFTERGMRTGCKCDIKPEGLWYYLYNMATSLFEIHHDGKPDVEAEFMRATGIEAAMGEGSQTNKDGKYRQLRKDEFEGKTIFVLPHVKLDSQRTGANNRRIYYCYDRELDRIIIGWIGMHLETAGTMHLN